MSDPVVEQRGEVWIATQTVYAPKLGRAVILRGMGLTEADALRALGAQVASYRLSWLGGATDVEALLR